MENNKDNNNSSNSLVFGQWPQTKMNIDLPPTGAEQGQVRGTKKTDVRKSTKEGYFSESYTELGLPNNMLYFIL